MLIVEMKAEIEETKRLKDLGKGGMVGPRRGRKVGRRRNNEKSLAKAVALAI